MSLAASYDSVLSRIQVVENTPGPYSYAVFDRTTNGGVTYTTVRGGSHVDISGASIGVDDYEWDAGVATTYRIRVYNSSDVLQFFDTVSITQDLTDAWFKIPAAPYLNTTVDVFEVGDVTRKSRAAVFDVVGRSNPVMVGDIASSVSVQLQLRTDTASEASNLDFLFASGEVVFVQLPSTVDWFPGGYYSAGDVSRTPVSKVSDSRIWTVPLTGVAAPGADVVSSAYTIASMIAEYATITDVIADNATISDLLARTGTPSDVIVP